MILTGGIIYPKCDYLVAEKGENMTEAEKIKSIITKHKAIFDGTDMDICQSIKGRWYFSRYNKEYNYYDCFREFDTADELVKIVLGELAFDMYYVINKNEEFQLPEYAYENISDILDTEIDYTKAITDLWEMLDKKL